MLDIYGFGLRLFHQWPIYFKIIRFLLYYYYQACEAGEGIIGHRGIQSVCLFVCLSVCLSVVCLSVIKLLPAYGTDHYQN